MPVLDFDKGWKRILKESALMNGSHVECGILSDAGAYADGGEVNIADVATFNEFGTSSIPPRPFMKQTFDKNIGETNEFISKQKDAIFSGKQTTKGALSKLGVFYSGKIKETFSKGEFEPNAQSTIRALANKILRGRKAQERAGIKNQNFKGKTTSKRPLIDTGRLRNSINYEVKLK